MRRRTRPSSPRGFSRSANRRGQEPPPSSEFNAAVEHYRERFVGFLDRMGDNVQDVGRKMADWLRRTTGDSAHADDDDA